MDLVKRYRVQAAHFLPDAPAGDPEGRLHGHCFSVELHVRGPLHPQLGWVIDFGDMTAAFQPIYAQIDHHLLNEVEGLDDPSAQGLARWIYQRVAPALPQLFRVVVVETAERRGSHPGENADER
jgi:6-pyruvoyltetrahydropterin/6-carboxytetrahydropterin synthase